MIRRLPFRPLLAGLALLALLAGVVNALPTPAYAGTGTVTTDDQLWVNQSSPASFNCTQWSAVFGGSTAQKRTVVSFPTSGVVPAGQTVTAATLRIYAKANYSGNNVSVKGYTRGTTGCNLTWNNLGTVGSQVGLSSGSFTKNTYKSITLDPASVSTSGRTAFVLDATAASLMEFRSDAAGGQLNPSKLDLTWAPTATTTTTIAPTTTVAPTTTTVAPTTTTAPPACTGVSVTPADNVQQLLDANPEGTTFCFAPGTYDHSTTPAWAPKANQQLIGALGANGERLSVVTGAKTLATWTPSGSTWYASGQTQQAADSDGVCRTTHPMCNSSNELFRDGARVKRVATLAQVTPSTWYFDTTADRIYVGQDPVGHTLQTSVADKAVLGAGVAGVAVKHFVVEMFATTWGAAVQVHDNNTGWLVEDVEARNNHLSGIEIVEQGTIRGCFTHHNGQQGTGAGKWPGGTVTNNLIEQTEMSYNNEAGFDPFWAAGGGKYAYNDGLILRGNHVHHNYGYGLWIDLDVIHADLDANTSEFNDLAGIHYEISWQGRIHHNIVRSNGQTEAGTGSYAGTGIYVFNSKDVEVDHNTVQDNLTGGIVARQYDRGSGLYGVYETANLNVHDNTVRVGAQAIGRAGALDGVAAGSPYYTSKNNHWQANTYQVPAAQGTGAAWFYWEAANRSFSAWQGYGHDTTGSITTY